MQLKSVKQKIRSIDRTKKVTRAMEAVSAVKMRKSQESALRARPYAAYALSILNEVRKSSEGGLHPLAQEKKEGKICFVVVTSDRGLAGSLNSILLKKVMDAIRARNIPQGEIGIISVGRRGYDYFSKRKFTILEKYEQWGDFIDFEMVEPLSEEVQELFLKEGYSEVWVAFTNFISTLKQTVELRRLLPLSYGGVQTVVEGILPKEGRYKDVDGKEENRRETYTFEPDPESVLEELVPVLLKIELYHTILEANASEHSARMVAMKNATDNAGEILEDLKRSYNKARQGAITREVSEIVGGMEALLR